MRLLNVLQRAQVRGPPGSKNNVLVALLAPVHAGLLLYPECTSAARLDAGRRHTRSGLASVRRRSCELVESRPHFARADVVVFGVSGCRGLAIGGSLRFDTIAAGSETYVPSRSAPPSFARPWAGNVQLISKVQQRASGSVRAFAERWAHDSSHHGRRKARTAQMSQAIFQPQHSYSRSGSSTTRRF